MKYFLTILTAFLLVGTCLAQQVKPEFRERRIYIRHADPALIIALISKNFTTNAWYQPEWSAWPNGNIGGGFQGSGWGGGSPGPGLGNR